MTHTNLPAIASESVSLPNQPFFAWLRTQTALFVGQLLALIGAVGSIVALAYYVGGLHVPPSFLTPPAISTTVIYSHLVFLTIFIIALIKGLDDNQRGVYRASRVYDRLIEDNFASGSLTDKGREELVDHSVKQVGIFKLWFLLFWCAMLFLYIVFTIETKYGSFFRPNPFEDVVEYHSLIFPFLTFLANNLSMFFIFGCFVALYLPAGRKDATQLSGLQAIDEKKRLMDQAAEHRSRQAKLRWWFGILLTLFTVSYPVIYWLRPLKLTIDNWSSYPAIFNALSGMLNAVVVALLIARLDSKLIGLPPYLISILYFYSGIQPMFVVFEQQLDEFDAIRAVVLVVVFIFKLYFFLIIFYSLQNGRLLNYFYCSPLLNQHVRAKPDDLIEDRPSKRNEANGKRVAQAPSSKRRRRKKKHRESKESRHTLNKTREILHEPTAKLKSPATRWRAEWPLIVSKLLGWIGITYFVISLLYYAKSFCSNEHWSILCHEEPFLFSPDLKLLLIYAHLPLLLIVIAFLIWVKERHAFADTNSNDGPKTKRQDSPPDAKSRLRQFQRFFLIFWCVMFVFYVAYAFKQSQDPSIIGGQINKVEAGDDSSSSHDPQAPEEKISVLCSYDERVAQRLERQLREGWTPLAVFSGEKEPINQRLWTESKEKQWAPIALSSSVPCASIVIEARFRKTEKNIELAQELFAERDLDPQFLLVQPPAEDENKQAQARDSAWIVGYSVITFLLNNLMVLFVFLCFLVLYLSVEDRHGSRKYRSLRNYAILVCLLITIATPLPLFSLEKYTMTIANPAVATTVIAAVGGVLNAVAFALLFARLDSRLIRLPSSVITILYAYAALQPLFVVFERGTPVFRAIETSALGAAFIFKISFVLVIFHALRSKSIEYHLEKFPLLNSRVNSIFDNQFEIRVYKAEKQFKYSIFKEDAELFRAIEPCDTREACDTAITDLLALMKDKDNYDKPAPIQGTHWVQIMNKKESDEPLCESKDLNSKDVVEDIIAECVEKVPYCKYSRS
jgi:hypothetical protein